MLKHITSRGTCYWRASETSETVSGGWIMQNRVYVMYARMDGLGRGGGGGGGFLSHKNTAFQA